MFLPTTQEEMKKRDWRELDIILVTGDTYIDSPFIGVALIGNILALCGYKVGIIAQPEMQNGNDILRLGEPRLFWGITSGSLDSMVANYTAVKKRRRRDDFTPGGVNSRRPDRAVIAYSNLIRRHFKKTKPLILGGIEASLRRMAHYDYWDDAVRRSLLFDAKADILVYGMGEKAIIRLAEKMSQGEDFRDIRGICYAAGEPKPGYLMLPSYTEVKEDKAQFMEMFRLFYQNNDPLTAKGLCQRQDTRYLIQNPPTEHLSVKEMDEIYDNFFERDVHPFYKCQGKVRALETIRFAITTHRGCYGECNFCSIAVHQGRTIRWRSADSIVREAAGFRSMPDFKGTISDVGGPTANMYGIECDKKVSRGGCRNKRCLYPVPCKQLRGNHELQRSLLQMLRKVPGIKKVCIASGIRYDMVMEDSTCGVAYLEDVVQHHVSGQLKIAPEHSEDTVLQKMAKPGWRHLQEFKNLFDALNARMGKKQFLTYYLIAAHPGCDEHAMKKLRTSVSHDLRIHPEQVQIFTPTPSTYSSLMYFTERDPWTGEKIFVEKDQKKREHQKEIIISGSHRRR